MGASKEKHVFSEQQKEEESVEHFMEYLIDSKVALQVIEFMVHLRGCDSFPDDPLSILRGTFASETNEKMRHYKSLISEYQVLKNENELLLAEAAQLEEVLEMERQKQRLRLEEEARLQKEEAQAEQDKKKKKAK